MEKRSSTCCFTGHRPEKLPWGYQEADPRCQALKRRIADAVSAAYDQGYRHFICGMAQGCDLYFCESVLALRQRHGDLLLEAALPCPTQARRWPARERERHARLLAACDLETMVSETYTPYCMQRRDRYMVDHASLLIAAYDGTAGGTQYTMLYAMRRGVSIVDLDILPRTRAPLSRHQK